MMVSKPPSRDPTDGLFRLARATKRQGAGALAAPSAGDLSGPRMVARARPAERRAGRLGLADRRRQIVGRAARLSRAARPVSRTDPRQGSGLLLRLRAAGVPVRLAPRSVGRRASQPQCDVARLLRRGLE